MVTVGHFQRGVNSTESQPLVLQTCCLLDNRLRRMSRRICHLRIIGQCAQAMLFPVRLVGARDEEYKTCLCSGARHASAVRVGTLTVAVCWSCARPGKQTEERPLSFLSLLRQRQKRRDTNETGGLTMKEAQLQANRYLLSIACNQTTLNNH